MIPDKEEHDDAVQTIIQRLKENGVSGYEIELIVAPWRSHDLLYEVDIEGRKIKFDVYSATYPSSLYTWLDSACREISLKIELEEKKK